MPEFYRGNSIVALVPVWSESAVKTSPPNEVVHWRRFQAPRDRELAPYIPCRSTRPPDQP